MCTAMTRHSDITPLHFRSIYAGMPVNTSLAHNIVLPSAVVVVITLWGRTALLMAFNSLRQPAFVLTCYVTPCAAGNWRAWR